MRSVQAGAMPSYASLDWDARWRIDEQALAGDVALSHGRRQPRLAGALELAVAAVAIAVRVDGAMLLPQRLQRHPWPAQLAVNCSPVRLRPPCRHRCYCRRSRVDTRFRTLVGDALPQRPGNAGSTCTLQASTTVVAPIERLAATFGSISQTPSAAERHGFCAWIVSVEACPLPSKGASYARFGITQRTLATPVHRLIVTSERVIGINRNDCSASAGARRATIKGRTGGLERDGAPRGLAPPLSPGDVCFSVNDRTPFSRTLARFICSMG
jgi:hypothetical protein